MLANWVASYQTKTQSQSHQEAYLFSFQGNTCERTWVNQQMKTVHITKENHRALETITKVKRILVHLEQVYRTRQHFVCSCVVQKPTQQHQASWAELSVLAQGQAGQVSVFRLYCNWFVSDFTLLSVSIYLFNYVTLPSQ